MPNLSTIYRKLFMIWYRLNPFRAYRMRKHKKEKALDQKMLIEDIKRGKSLLEMIDNNMVKRGLSRKQRKQFWKEFVSSQNVRGHVYSTIEKAFEGESRYRKKWEYVDFVE